MTAAIEEVKAMSHYETEGEACNTYRLICLCKCMHVYMHVSVSPVSG